MAAWVIKGLNVLKFVVLANRYIKSLDNMTVLVYQHHKLAASILLATFDTIGIFQLGYDLGHEHEEFENRYRSKSRQLRGLSGTATVTSSRITLMCVALTLRMNSLPISIT